MESRNDVALRQLHYGRSFAADPQRMRRRRETSDNRRIVWERILLSNTYFKHPDNFRGTIAMSGSYDIYSYLDKGYYDDNVYFNNPTMYVKNMHDDYNLPRLQNADSIVIATGQGAFEAPHKSQRILRSFKFQGNSASAWIFGDTMSLTTGFGGAKCCRIISANSSVKLRITKKELRINC